MLGSFDARFLHLPREILITVMRDHQRYFALEYRREICGPLASESMLRTATK